MDLIGKLAVTGNGNHYICVIIDYLTKWPQAYPLKTKTAQEVTDCLLKFVYQFEAPQRVLTDQGKEFVNENCSSMHKVLNIERSLCAPYHPQTNGLVERMNGTIQRALCKLVKDQPKDWDRHLDAVMFGLRTKVQMTTKYSPFFLMFGREARYPSQITEYRIDKTVEDTVSTEEVTESAINLNKILTDVKGNIRKSQETVKKRLKHPLTTFKVGDKVWRRNIRAEQRKGGKLESNYLGPFAITCLEGKSADLEDVRGVTFPKINIDHLKHHVDDLPRVPRRLQKPSSPSAVPVTTDSLKVPLLLLQSPHQPQHCQSPQST
ncbi:hypothetical protein PO909_027412 [Leuciscus waleckii]